MDTICRLFLDGSSVLRVGGENTWVKEKQENQPIFTALIGILSYYYTVKISTHNTEY